MPASHDLPGPTPLPSTLATANLPRRVRRVLDHLLTLVSDEMARHFDSMLNDFEQQLFRLADHARNPGLQAGYMETLRTMRLNRADLVPRYLIGLESALAGLRDHSPRSTVATAPAPFRHLSLVDDESMDEESVLRDIAMRHESRANLPLHLLGQRFGVLAGTPAFDAERLPVGPQILCRILREASQSLQIGLEARLLLFRTFERTVMQRYTQLAETHERGARTRKRAAEPGLRPDPRPTGPAEPGAGHAGAGRPGRQRRAGASDAGRRGRSAAPGLPTAAPANVKETVRIPPGLARWMATIAGFDENAAFLLLQQLLSGRRDLIGKLRPDSGSKLKMQLGTPEILGALDAMQSTPSPTGTPRNLLDIKHSLLAQSRQLHGKGATLSREDNDTFELLGMLYSQIDREVRRDTPAVGLLDRLQVPLLRVALQDRAFFVRQQHPARQLLNAVAESGANWLGDDEIDPQLTHSLRQAVDHVVEHYHDDPAVFEDANRELQTNLQQLARKAEVTERRHVEAARGKEKLELAKHRAAEVIEAAVRDQRLPKFVRALLNQAWADVLTLTLLRHGEDSDGMAQAAGSHSPHRRHHRPRRSQRRAGACRRRSNAPWCRSATTSTKPPRSRAG